MPPRHPKFSEAYAAWQWCNCAARCAAPGLTLLRINLDETSVCLFQGSSKGAVRCSKRRQDSRPEPVQRVARSKKRACLTHVALLCDGADLQPLLPQFIVGNERTFLVRDREALRAACPSNVHLVRQKSAWNNIALCARIVKMLGAALRAYCPVPFVRRWQPVLLLDACRLHLHRSIVDACLAEGIWPILVPAKLTWLLQPLDTDAFQLYKVFLRKAYQRARLLTADGDLTVAQFMVVLCDAIRNVLQGRRWAGSFDKNGFGAGQAQVSKYILQNLQLDAVPQLPSAAPTAETLSLCFPRKCQVEAALWLKPYLQSALPAPAIGPPVGARLPVGRRLLPRRPPLRGAAPLQAVAAAGPQTRSQSRLAAALSQGPPLPRPLPPLRRRGG